MTDKNTISQVVESLFEDWIDKNINVHPLAVENMRILEADALALLKESEAIVRCKDCQFYNEGRNEVDAWMQCRLHSMNTSPDEFCSWAVKKN